MGKKSRLKKARVSLPPPAQPSRHPAARPSRRVALVAAAVVAAVLAVGLTVAFGHSGRSPALTLGHAVADQASLPGLQVSPPPWPAEHATLAARLQALGLPQLQMEGDAVHTHQHLDLYVDGRRVRVPALIGISEQQRFLAPIHTHDATGIVHIESPTRARYTLGQLFAIWGVRLTRTCIGGLCDRGGKTLAVFANGKRVAADPGRLALEPHEEIVVAFGNPSQLPRPIPSRYRFPAGL